MRRLLAFQLMLTKKKGLPLSRLLTIKETDSRCSKREEQMRSQEESASPLLNRKSVKVVKEEVRVGEKEDVKEEKEEKEEEGGPGKEVLSSGSKYFTLRNFPTVADPPSTQPLPHGPCLPPSTSPAASPPLFTPPWIPFIQAQQFGQMPAANWVVCGSCQMWGTVVPFWAAHST